jgi:hypothetical protein
MKHFLNILAVLILTVAWTRAQPSTLYPLPSDSPTYVNYKMAYGIAYLVEHGMTVTATLGGTNVGATVLNTVTVTGGISVTNQLLAITDTWTRPANTSAYAAGDAVCTATTANGIVPRPIALLCRAGSGVIIKRVSLDTFQATNSAGWRIWFYNATNATQGDNVAFNLAQTNAPQRIGFLDLTNAVAGTDCAYLQNIADQLPCSLAAGETNLYYSVQTLNAFAPVTSQTNVFKFLIDTR